MRQGHGTIGCKATRDLVALGRMMGHPSLQSTLVYAAAADDVSAKIATEVTR